MTSTRLNAACLSALSALVLCGCPRDQAPRQAEVEPERSSWRPPVMPPAAVPKPAPLTVGAVSAPETRSAPAIQVRLLVRNKRLQGLPLAKARIPRELTAAQLGQAPGGLSVEAGERKVEVVVGASLDDYVRFLLGTLGALDDSLRKDLAPYLPAESFMGLKRVVGSAFQQDQSLLVLQTSEGDPDTLRFSYLTPLGLAPQLPYVKDLEVPRRAWVAAATAALEVFFTKAEALSAPRTTKPADQRARALLGLWHQVGWKLKLS